jgi:cytochrome c oxidase subunit 4
MAERVSPQSTYYAVFGALIALTILTVGVSLLNLGEWHTVVGLVIATAKALLVTFFFMHLLRGSRLSWVALVSGLFWLGILMVPTLADYLTRHWLSY